MKQVEVCFYANGFRETLIDVPDNIAPKSHEEEKYIYSVLNASLLHIGVMPRNGLKFWGYDRIGFKDLPICDKSSKIIVITAKIK